MINTSVHIFLDIIVGSIFHDIPLKNLRIVMVFSVPLSSMAHRGPTGTAHRHAQWQLKNGGQKYTCEAWENMVIHQETSHRNTYGFFRVITKIIVKFKSWWIQIIYLW